MAARCRHGRDGGRVRRPVAAGDLRVIDRAACQCPAGRRRRCGEVPRGRTRDGRGRASSTAAGVSAYKGLGRTSLLSMPFYWKSTATRTPSISRTRCPTASRWPHARRDWALVHGCCRCPGSRLVYDGCAGPRSSTSRCLSSSARPAEPVGVREFGLTDRRHGLLGGTSWRITK